MFIPSSNIEKQILEFSFTSPHTVSASLKHGKKKYISTSPENVDEGHQEHKKKKKTRELQQKNYQKKNLLQKYSLTTYCNEKKTKAKEK